MLSSSHSLLLPHIFTSFIQTPLEMISFHIYFEQKNTLCFAWYGNVCDRYFVSSHVGVFFFYYFNFNSFTRNLTNVLCQSIFFSKETERERENRTKNIKRHFVYHWIDMAKVIFAHANSRIGRNHMRTGSGSLMSDVYRHIHRINKESHMGWYLLTRRNSIRYVSHIARVANNIVYVFVSVFVIL